MVGGMAAGLLGLGALMCPAASAEPVDPAVELLVSKGRCVEVQVAGARAACVAKAGVIQVRYRSGRSVLMVGLKGGKAIAFVATSERKEGSDSILDVERVRVGKDGVAPATPVTGACRLAWSADRTAWTDIDCTAKDEKGRPYALRFEPSGSLEIERE